MSLSRRHCVSTSGRGTSARSLRRIYREWFALLASRLARVPGATVELGSGIGQLREFVPNLETTDVRGDALGGPGRRRIVASV